MHIIHGSCVVVEGKGVLLLGKSGAGKSDLALRLIDAGAELVGDDQIALSRTNDTIIASPPPKLSGLLEVRGVGLINMPYLLEAQLHMAVQLVGSYEEVERHPEEQSYDCDGISIPLISLCAFEHSAPTKVKAALGNLPAAAIQEK